MHNIIQKIGLLLISLLSINIHIYSQTNNYTNYHSPYDFTNRPMGMLNDASAVQWNPGLLGIRGVADFQFAVPMNEKFSLIDGHYSLIAKVNNLGLGFIRDKFPNNVDSLSSLKTIFAGAGFNIIPNKLWLGTSAMYRGNFKDKYGIKTFRYNASFVYTPMSSLITSVGVSNMYKDFNFVNWTFGMIYSPFEWMSLHANVGYSPQGHFRGGSKYSPDVYLSFGGLSDYLIFSLGYKYQTNSFRLGLELSVDRFSFGTIPIIKNKKYAGSNIFFRLRNERFLNVAELRNRSTISVKHTNAGISDNGYLWSPADNNASPSEIIDILNKAGSKYKSIYNKLNTASNKADAMKYIANKYYLSENLLNENLNNSMIKTPWKYNIISLQEATINVNQKIIRFKVKDEFGRDKAKLSRKDFIIDNNDYTFVTVDEVNAMPKEKIDIVFLQDCSPSLSGVIDEVKLHLTNFLKALEIKGIDYNVGGILYGEQIYEVLHPTSEINKFLKFYNGATANAIDEVTSIALSEALDLKFRNDAKKVIILITDEPTFQTNSNITETELINKYWENSARIFSILDFSKYNSGLLTKLTLGKEYEIFQDVSQNLMNIASDILSYYSAIVKPKGKVNLPSAVLKGYCKDEDNWSVGAVLSFIDGNGREVKNYSNAISGEYEINIPEEKINKIIAYSLNHDTIFANIDMRSYKKGDTLEYNFIFKNPKSSISGIILDNNNKPIKANLIVSDLVSGENLFTIESDSTGNYFANIQEGKIYSITAKAENYIPLTKKIDALYYSKGTPIVENYNLTLLDDAINQQISFIVKDIVFEPRQFVLNEESYNYLNRLAEFLKNNPEIFVEISAHTDSIGTEESNDNLSINRAKSVADYLLKKGISPNSVKAIGMGSRLSIATNETEEGRAKNRRIEIKFNKK